MTESAPIEQLGLRERKKLATARALEFAALQLVDTRGLDAVTIDEIAAAADVSPRTFFNYYSSKEAALVGGMSSGARRFASALLDRPDDEPPLVAARAVFVERAPELERHADRFRLSMRVVRRHRELYPYMVGSFGEWERTIGAAIAQRTGTDHRADAYPMLAAAAVAGIMRSSMRVWALSDFTAPLDGIFTSAFDLVDSGMRGPA